MNVALTIAGIAVPALLLVAAIRRWITPVRWNIAFLFLALTLAFLNGAVFTSRLPVPVDEVARGYPYRGIFGEITAKNPLTNDTVKLFLPWMQVAREELLHGRAPLWNRYAFSGYPLLANGESAPFSPFFLATLFVPLPKQIVAMAGLKIFVSLLFGFLFLKRERLSDAAAVLGSSAFAFSVFETVFLYYSTVTVTALLPAALFALFYAMDVEAKRGVVLSALVVGSLMASGHPESVLHIAMAAFVLFAIDFGLARERRQWLARFRFPLLGAVMGLVLSAPSWVPVAEQVLLSTRFAELRHAAHEPALPWAAAWAMVAPNGFGNPVRHNWSWIHNYSTIASSYFGLVVTAAFAAANLSRRGALKYRLWSIAAVVSFLVAMQWTFVGSVFWKLPLMSVSANDKLRFVACFLVAAVAAKWLDSRPSALAFGALALPLIVLVVYAWWKHPAIGRPQDLTGAIAALSLLVMLIVPQWRGAIPFAAAVLCVIELFTFNVPFNALVDAKYYRPRLPIIEALKKRAPNEPFRIAALDWAFLPNAAAQYGLEDVRGSDPMSYATYTDFLSLIATEDAGTDVLRVINVDHPALDHLNARFLITAPGASAGEKWRLVYRAADGRIFENRGVLGRFYAPAAVQHRASVLMSEVGAISDFRTLAIVADGRDAFERNGGVSVDAIEQVAPASLRFRARASGPALIVSSEPWDRWWAARANGRRCRTIAVNGAFVGVYVPSGDSHVTLSYEPWSYYGSVAAAAIAAAGLIFSRSRRIEIAGAPEMVE